jgi:hypothetical protein
MNGAFVGLGLILTLLRPPSYAFGVLFLAYAFLLLPLGQSSYTPREPVKASSCCFHPSKGEDTRSVEILKTGDVVENFVLYGRHPFR